MSRFSRETWCLVLGQREVALWSTSRAQGRRLRAEATLASDVARPAVAGIDEPAIQAAVAGLVDGHVPRGASVSTLVQDECARYFMVDPPDNARRPADLRSAAALRLETLHGEPAEVWTVDADWRASRRFLACAAPDAAIRAVAGALAAARIRDAGMCTEFVAGWNAHCRRMTAPRCWVLHAGRRLAVFAACEGGKVVDVSTMAFPEPGLALDDAMPEVRRCALRWGRPQPGTVYLLGSGWADAADGRMGETRLVRLPTPAAPATAEASR
ncbi:MAG TPA: hypothetical protein VF457_11780 [Burkholderiaceae bacterium]